MEENKNFLKAIEINPNYASAHHWYGEFLSQFDKQEHARAEIDRAMELDPLSLVMMSDSAYIYYQTRQYDAAIAQAKKALELDPNWLFAKGAMSAAYEVKGEFGKSLEIWSAENEANQMRPEKEKQEIRDGLAKIRKGLETDGAHGYWLGAYEYARRDPRDGDDLYIAICLTQLGRLSEAIDELEKTVSHRQSFSGTIKVEPLLDPLRSEPRFKALMDKTGLNTEF